MKFTFGADPEIFVFSKETGTAVSAHGMVPGSKNDPFPVPNGAIQVDGMALEFNINPASSKKQFTGNVFSVLKHMQSLLPEGLETRVAASAHFSRKYMRDQPFEAVQLGCDPDFNAYTRDINPPPYDPGNMRTAAGHIHIGWGKGGYDVNSVEHLSSCYMLAKAMDLWVGVWSLYRDRDKFRREMYGRAGCFRPKPYGMEYRTLSNFWIQRPELSNEVFDRTKQACNWALKGQGFTKPYHEEEIKEAINYSNMANADSLVKDYGIVL